MIQSLLAFGLMVVELLVAEFIISAFLQRRDFFWVRFIGSSLVCIVIALWIWAIYGIFTGKEFDYNGVNDFYDSVFKFVYYVVVFALTVAAFKYSFKGSIWTVLFYCAGGYAMQHIAYNVFSLIGIIPPVGAFFDAHIYVGFLAEVLCCAAIYSAVYFLFIRKRSAPDEIKDLRGKVFLFLIVIFVCIFISRFTKDNTGRDVMTMIAESAAAILNCSFILVFLFDITDKDKAKNELQVMKELMRREKEQYRMTKENIDLINVKCHDLKHQIQALRENASEQYIKKIEDAVMFYDSVAKTGNDILDVILTEKSLLCEQNRITFTCVVRGEDLAFMDGMDIYSLFGNALSNAFEHVSKIEDKDKRCISLNVRTENDALSIHLENFYDGEIAFEDGLPVTSKSKDYHGFGVKSMDYIAKKYNGCMSISTQDGIFSLDFAFPLSKDTVKADKTEKKQPSRRNL